MALTQALILAYHRVLPDAADQTLAVSVSDFQWQLQVLKKRKYIFMTLGDFYSRHVSGNEPIYKNVAIITFDDGYADNYLYALPILKSENIRATFFVSTAYINQNKPYYWDLKNKINFDSADLSMTEVQLKELKAHGMEIGSHTVNHYELPMVSVSEIQYELMESKKTLENILKTKVNTICYPRGMASDSVFKIAKQTGYVVGVVTKKPGVPSSTYALPRVGIYGHDTRWTFLLKTTPLYSWFRSFR